MARVSKIQYLRKTLSLYSYYNPTASFHLHCNRQSQLHLSFSYSLYSTMRKIEMPLMVDFTNQKYLLSFSQIVREFSYAFGVILNSKCPLTKFSQKYFSCDSSTKTCDKKGTNADKKLSLLNQTIMCTVNMPDFVTNSDKSSFVDKDDFKSSEDNIEITLEKNLMSLMRSWQIDQAVTLLMDSISDGMYLDRTVLLNTLQQIADLGKVECLLQLQDVLKDKELISNVSFYKCLCLALFNSGRIVEGMTTLVDDYEKGMDAEDAQIKFTLLSTSILKHFPHHYHVVEDFVTIMLNSEPPLLSARALLWKCCVLAEKFDKADELKEAHEELKKMIPAQVTSIIQSSSHIDHNRDEVFLWLIKQPYLKEGLKASIFHLLLQRKCDNGAWSEALDCVMEALDNGIRIQQETIKNFLTKFFEEISEDHLHFWKMIAENVKKV